MKYKDLFIDVDDTLLDFKKDEHEAIVKTFEALNIEPNNTNINLYSAINATLWEMHNHGNFEKSKIRVARFEYTLQVLQRNDIDPVDAANIYVRCLGETGNLFEGVKATLKLLKQQGYRLFLITNGFTSIQTPRFKRSGIDQLVDKVFISEAIGCNKPDVSFMEHVAQSIDNYDPKASLIIGDSLSSDIRLGINCGIDTVAINKKPIPDATYQFNSFNEIVNLLH